jgi:hypothetical protein
VIPRWRLATVLVVASAFSSFPSVYYGTISADVDGGAWTTPVLFASHGIAAIVAMSMVATPTVSTAIGRAAPGRVLAVVLVVDALAGLVLAFSGGSAEFALVLVGRVVTGLALGALTPVVAAALASHPSGSAISTAGILGGVGVGSAIAGTLALLDLTRPEVFGIGCAALVVAAALVAFPTAHPSSELRRPSGSTARLPWFALGAAGLAFAANGVLGLFTSVLPGIVAAPREFTAGLTVAAVLLAAGVARLAVPAARIRVARVSALFLLVLGALAFLGGLAGASIALSLIGGVMLGLAAGIAYDTALSLAASRTIGAARMRALATVQRGGQLGLVIPVLLFPLAIQR